MNYYLLTQTVLLMKSENIYDKFFIGKIYLTLVIIQKIRAFFMGLIKKILVK